MDKIFWILCFIQIRFQGSFSKSLRSKRFVDFSIRCRQNNDFTWECRCPQRNVIMTLSNSGEETFLVCGLDFRLSLLSKTPRYMAQRRQLASDFDKMIENEKPNKMFREKDDFYKSLPYQNGDYSRIQEPLGYDTQGFGDNRRFENSRLLQDDFLDFGYGQNDKSPDDFGRNRNPADYNQRNGYRDGYENRIKPTNFPKNRPLNNRNQMSLLSTTSHEGLISQEKLDHNLKQVLDGFSQQLKDYDKPDTSKKAEGASSQNKFTQENSNFNKNHINENSKISTNSSKSNVDNEARVSESEPGIKEASTLQKERVRADEGEHDFEKFVDEPVVEKETSALVEGGNANEATHVPKKTIDKPGHFEKETQTSTKVTLRPLDDQELQAPLEDDRDIQKDDRGPVRDLVNLNDERPTQMPKKGTIKSQVVQEPTLKTGDIGNYHDEKHTTAGKTPDNVLYSQNVVNENVVDSMPDSNVVKQRKIDRDHGLNQWPMSTAAKTSETTVQIQDSNKVFENNKTSNGKDDDEKSKLDDLPQNNANRDTGNNDTHSVKAAIESKDSQNGETSSIGCFFSGKFFSIGESVKISYSCKMVCLKQNSMKRDCSGTRMLENEHDPDFSFSRWHS